jgi:hypothetical protein
LTAPGRDPRRRRRLFIGLGVLAAVAIVTAALILAAGGSDDDCCAPPDEVDDVPASAVAIVDGAPEESVPVEGFEPALARAAAISGQKVPDAGDPGYGPLRDQAMAELLNNHWIAGEAEERGIPVPSDEEVDERLDETIDASFPSREQFEKFVADQAYCTADELATIEPERCGGLREQVRTSLLADSISNEALGTTTPDTGDPDVAEEVEAFRDEFVEKWRARTVCAEAYLNPRCSNGGSTVDSAPTAPGPTPGEPGYPGVTP